MPTPTIRKTYLAKSRSGRIVLSFDSPDKLREFLAKSAQKSVHLTAWEETTVCKPLPEHRAIADPVVKLKAVGGKG